MPRASTRTGRPLCSGQRDLTATTSHTSRRSGTPCPDIYTALRPEAGVGELQQQPRPLPSYRVVNRRPEWEVTSQRHMASSPIPVLRGHPSPAQGASTPQDTGGRAPHPGTGAEPAAL